MVQRLPPGFLWGLAASARFMRVSLKKTAHAVVSSAAYRKSGSGGLGTTNDCQRLQAAVRCSFSIRPLRPFYRARLCRAGFLLRSCMPIQFCPWITRISCTRLQPSSAYAAFIKESRMKYINATELHRKSWIRQKPFVTVTANSGVLPKL